MKNLTLVILALLVISTSSFASSIELARTDKVNSISVLVEKPITNQLGAFAFTTQNQFWGETYAGLTYAPTQNIQFALGAGYETGGSRTGGWIWAGKNKISAIYCFEDGASGPWHKLVAKLAVTPRFSLGYTEKSFAGSGIYAEFKLSKETTLKYSGFKKPELALTIRI